jgi:hypothetical protein
VTYISHARTAEELRLEVLSDLNRRIELLRGQRTVGLWGRGAAGKARVDGKITELEDMLVFWSELQLAAKLSPRAQSAP